MTARDEPIAGTVTVAIIGAGVVGAATARALARRGVDVAVLERGDDVAVGTSKANTAILHTGFDAPQGSVEARLVGRGYELLRVYAPRVGIAIEETGALLVAWNDDQLAQLPAIAAKAASNGCTSLTDIGARELYELEPHLGPGALGGLRVPGEHVVDPWTTPLAYLTDAVLAGARFHRRAEVIDVVEHAAGHELVTTRGRILAEWVVNAAGLHGDVVHRLLGHDSFTIRPRRGELIVFDELARRLVRHVLLPVPTATTKGVLVAPTVFGNVLLGPTADDIDDRDDTATTREGIDRLLAQGRRIVPALLDEEVTATYAGLRPATEQSDYRIELHREQRYLCLGGIRSTGLTASMAIAEEAVELLRGAGLATADEESPALPSAHLLNLGEQGARSWQHGGVIVCHCERVTEDDLASACHSVVPPAGIDGVRRRTRAMLGRCQGFACTGRVVSTIADLLDRSPSELLA